MTFNAFIYKSCTGNVSFSFVVHLCMKSKPFSVNMKGMIIVENVSEWTFLVLYCLTMSD